MVMESWVTEMGEDFWVIGKSMSIGLRGGSVKVCGGGAEGPSVLYGRC